MQQYRRRSHQVWKVWKVQFQAMFLAQPAITRKVRGLPLLVLKSVDFVSDDYVAVLWINSLAYRQSHGRQHTTAACVYLHQ
jgi:hypothetical protein